MGGGCGGGVCACGGGGDVFGDGCGGGVCGGGCEGGVYGVVVRVVCVGVYLWGLLSTNGS